MSDCLKGLSNQGKVKPVKLKLCECSPAYNCPHRAGSVNPQRFPDCTALWTEEVQPYPWSKMELIFIERRIHFKTRLSIYFCRLGFYKRTCARYGVRNIFKKKSVGWNRFQWLGKPTLERYMQYIEGTISVQQKKELIYSFPNADCLKNCSLFDLPT